MSLLKYCFVTLLLLTPSLVQANSTIEESLNNPSRPLEDRKFDANRKPDQVLALAELKAGDKVLDLFAGSGYYSELISHIVGSEGEVVSQNNNAYIKFLGNAIDRRYTNDRLTNIKRITAEANDLELEENTFDSILMILTLHDFYHSSDFWPAIDAPAVLTKLYKSLKPGGTLIVVDHIGPDADIGENSEKLHRIYPEHAKKALSSAGFKLVTEADFLKNAEDPLNIPMMDAAVRGNTSRLVYKLTK